MKLTDTKVRNLKPREKQYKVSDGKNLFLVITPPDPSTGGSNIYLFEKF